MARISGIQSSYNYHFSNFLLELEKTLTKEFSEILRLEAEFWQLKSRINWLAEGDANTSFFHLTTLNRKRKNKTLAIRNEVGEWIHDSLEIKQKILLFYSNLYKSELNSSPRVITQGKPRDIILGQAEVTSLFYLLKDIEIKKALFSFKPKKAPEPDGLYPLFYQKYWDIVKNQVTSFCHKEYISHFKSMKGRKENMILKIDLEKAFDRLEWSFIREMLSFFNFPAQLSKIIMSCISTSSISVLVNGGKTMPFQPTRGIRRGDPMSPYIFILWMELLPRSIEHRVNQKDWTPISVSKGGPKISHLFFADDLTLFSQANSRNVNTMLDTLASFSTKSRQRINFTKSKVVFSSNTTLDSKRNISTMLGINQSDSFGKYLGFPIFYNKPTNANFQYIIDNLNNMMAGWKTQFMNMAGRTTLAKATLSSTQNHTMQYIALPSNVTKHIHRAQRNFIWGTTSERKRCT
ncbi:uncharacterized protein LOC132631242 [Lycium barbarum]|uniref:uncharacterized protein LOC132631242 n=1 Tax=Lycium barbarum TaxID=112863 RepID=UPI00293EE8DE|nr:uncharacterized protein LOC132631242 [Lycium barbarum]